MLMHFPIEDHNNQNHTQKKKIYEKEQKLKLFIYNSLTYSYKTNKNFEIDCG